VKTKIIIIIIIIIRIAGVKLKITCLIENVTENPDMACEHGLSFFIEKNGLNILFDTGSTGTFVENARKIGINLENLDATVLSHGHYDHCGGLESFFKINNESPIYLRKNADGDYYLKYLIVFKKYIGLNKEILTKNLSRTTFLEKNTEILPGIHLITNIRTRYPVPTGSKYLYQKKNNKLLKDDFSHELMMIIEEKDGIILISGCSHHGILNMVETALDCFPNKKIKAVFGGFHLIGLPLLNNIADSTAQVKEIGQKLVEYPIDKVYTGHCTGEKAYSILKEIMGDKLEYFATSNVVDID